MTLDTCPTDAELLARLEERCNPISQNRRNSTFCDSASPRQPVSPQKRTRAKSAAPTEHAEQVALFAWIDTEQRIKHPEFGFIFAIPNGAFRSPSVAGKSKAEGQRPGYPDIAWDLPCGPFRGFRGELKRQGSGVLSPLQQEWHVWLERCRLYVCTVHGWEAMRDELLAYYALRAVSEVHRP